ncbi:hypothetical protein F441_22680 [Phytophthora nicotianae CJ01A1]|uniref:Chromo domain-containing protein n=1 Tax=Phytophthora nicotianae CJ01A1 TaxID=1317063 RepID=W2VR63_PHYNI|nr:hypothetical protein F441_22680 [Phytophthora nicotianae CJ01A1]
MWRGSSDSRRQSIDTQYVWRPPSQNFDEGMLPEDSWERELEEDEYEVERIADVRSSKKPRYGRTRREYLVFWKDYAEPSWVDKTDLNCGALLRDFDRGRTDRNRSEAMQSH